MKNFCAKFLISSFVVINALPASAQLYKYTFNTGNYTDQNTPTVPGTLSGYIVIDSELATQDPQFTNGSNLGTSFTIAIPNWLDDASLTFTSDGSADAVNAPSVTRTLTGPGAFDALFWTPNAEIRNGQSEFNFDGDFTDQMSAFALSNDGEFVKGNGMIQVFNFTDANGDGQSGEFRLVLPISSEEVPGPLPLLGLIPLAYYSRKLKKKIKN